MARNSIKEENISGETVNVIKKVNLVVLLKLNEVI